MSSWPTTRETHGVISLHGMEESSTMTRTTAKWIGPIKQQRKEARQFLKNCCLRNNLLRSSYAVCLTSDGAWKRSSSLKCNLPSLPLIVWLRSLMFLFLFRKKKKERVRGTYVERKCMYVERRRLSVCIVRINMCQCRVSSVSFLSVGFFTKRIFQWWRHGLLHVDN